jgi:hypothetical protein
VVRVYSRSTRDIYTRNIPPSWAGAFQRGPVENSCVWSSLHLNRHNSLLRDPIDVPFVAYESRLSTDFHPYIILRVGPPSMVQNTPVSWKSESVHKHFNSNLLPLVSSVQPALDL